MKKKRQNCACASQIRFLFAAFDKENCYLQSIIITGIKYHLLFFISHVITGFCIQPANIQYDRSIVA